MACLENDLKASLEINYRGEGRTIAQEFYIPVLKRTKFYDRILQEVVLIMNGYHNTDYSIRYWEIVIGPWLKRFIEITYDRWEMITLVLLNNNIHYTMALKIPDNEVTPDGFGGFASLHEDDLWNHWMYTKIIKFHGSVDTKMVSYLKESKNERSKVSLKLIAINALKRSAKLINCCANFGGSIPISASRNVFPRSRSV